MKKTKKHRFYHNWTFGGVLISILIILFIGSLIAHVMLFGIESPRKRNSFSNADWEYMINYIETEYGNGKEFIVFKKESKKITKSRLYNFCYPEGWCYKNVYIGEKANIIGNFEGEEKGYFVSFSRYISDSPYKNGNNVITLSGIIDSYDIDEYKK